MSGRPEGRARRRGHLLFSESFSWIETLVIVLLAARLSRALPEEWPYQIASWVTALVLLSCLGVYVWMLAVLKRIVRSRKMKETSR